MDSSMHFLDGNYNPFGHMDASSFAYESGFFEYDQMDAFFSEVGLPNSPLNSIYGNEHIAEGQGTCNPVDAMGPQIDFSEYLRDEWSETAAPPAGGSEVLIAPDVLVPQLMTPPIPAVMPPLLVPSTPKRPSLNATTGGSANTGLISPPPSNRPIRIRRHNAYDELCQLSNLGLNTPRSKRPAAKSAPVFATPLPPPSCALRTPANSAVHHDLETRYLSPPSSCSSSSSSSSSATFSPIDSPSSSISSTFGTPPSPPETPVRRPTRRAGVDRPRFSRRGSGGNPYSRPRRDPAPSGDSQRPHACRHPGNIVPGDVPCGKDFARMHDWVRHQRVHTGQTPYRCLNCDKQFKRSDARGRHWDSKPACEDDHMSTIRQLLLQGQITTEHPDVPILRRRAQKAEYRKESKRTGIPIQELKASMQQVKHENISGPGF